MAHTPGPWTATKVAQVWEISPGLGDEEALSLAATPARKDERGKWIQPTEQDMDNARLIAAAPDLLVACQEAYVALPMAEKYKGTNAALMAAIVKAGGRV